MAQTLAQVYQTVIDEKNSKSTLVGLLPTVDNLNTLLADISSSPSNVAVWRIWALIYATCSWSLQSLWDIFLIQEQALIDNKEPGVLRWYQEIAFKFQFGDPLVWLNSKYQYAVIDTTHCIVNRCAAIDRGGTIVIKAAIFDGTNIVPLSAAQKVAFEAYMQMRKFAGPALTTESNDPDTLKLYYTIYYNPLADLTILQPAVEAAINAYIAEVSGINNPDEFNGRFNLTRCTDTIQQVTNVIDPRLTDAQWTYGGNPYAAIVGEQQSNAGYFIIDPAVPLSTTITYVPYV